MDWLIERIAAAIAAKLVPKFEAAVAKMEAVVVKIEGLRFDVGRLSAKVDTLTAKVDVLIAGATGTDAAQLKKLSDEITKAAAAAVKLTDAMAANPNP